jgi:hypothetical protein
LFKRKVNSCVPPANTDFTVHKTLYNYFTVSEAVVVLGEGTKVNTSIDAINTKS